jgi:tRNA-2-methylthio-N6-dimethylallyladenosine synthase
VKKFFIQTFGCQMNVYDSERVAVMLSSAGWLHTENASNADIIIINSCSVRDKPLKKLFSCAGRYLPLKRKKGTIIFIMGCVAQQLGRTIIERAPYIDGVFGPGAEDLILQIVEKGKYPFVSNDQNLLEREEIFPESSKGAFFEKHVSSITVMHGCNNFCSYCIVPFVRGREVSRKETSILHEVDMLLEKGVLEITLLGQNVNSYKDLDTGADFTKLLYDVAKKEGLQRLRFMTSHPKDFNEKLAIAFTEIPQLMPNLHLPAQSGSDRILKMMNRKYTVADYLGKLEMARKYLPDVALSGDFIVGFPDETEDDFEQTLQLIDMVGYDVIYAFAYSPRPMTQASMLKDNIPPDVKAERLNRLLDAQKNRMKEVRNRYLNRTVKVLIEKPSPKSSTLMGRNEHNLVTHVVNAVEEDIGRIVDVKILEVLENTLRGQKV